MSHARRALIVGGTGQIGRAVARELSAHSWEVVVAHRGRVPMPSELREAGVAVCQCDREQQGELARALGSGADAIIDVTAFDATHAHQLLELQADVGAFIVVSSASVYRDTSGRTLDEAASAGFPDFPVPIPETQPTVEPGPLTYSTRKVALEHALLDGMSRPVTILRPGAVYGPGSQHPREWWLVKRFIDGRRCVPLAYRGQSRFHPTAAANLAAAVRAALDNQGRQRILNVADAEAPNVAEIARLSATHMGYKGRFIEVDDTAYPPIIGRTPWSLPRPIVIDTGAARELGYLPALSYQEALFETLDWLIATAWHGDWRARFPVLAAYPRELFDYAEEDSFLEQAGAHC